MSHRIASCPAERCRPLALSMLVTLISPSVVRAESSIPVVPSMVFVADGAHCAAPVPRPDGTAVAIIVDDRARGRRTLHLVEHGTGALPTSAESPSSTNRVLPTEAPTPSNGEGDDALRALVALGGDVSSPRHPICHEFAWGPDGSFVTSCVQPDGQYDLFASRGGRPLKPLVTHPGHDGLPTIDRDSRLVFSSGRSGQGDLYLLDPRRGVRPLIESADRAELHARWSPDGSAVLYLAQQSGEGDGDLFVVPVGAETSASDAVPARLTEGGGAEVGADWSPDGRWIAWYRARAGESGHDLYAAPARGGPPRRLAERVVAPDRLPAAWTPDSRAVIVARRSETIDALEIVRMDGGATRLETGTILGHSPAVVMGPGGLWRVYWVAQASTGDTERRWDRIYAADIDPARAW